jgi:hypothetical protein
MTFRNANTGKQLICVDITRVSGELCPCCRDDLPAPKWI